MTNNSVYIKVFNKILIITSNDIEFECEKGRITFLRRVDNEGNVIWKLLKDGLFVRKEFVESYKLMTNPIDIA